jgi:hypothetical protein
MSNRQRDANGTGATPLVHVRRRGRLLILQCPHCRKRHVHGDGGQRGRGMHGHRLAHCRNPRDAGVGYVLVEVSEPQTVPTARPPAGGRASATERTIKSITHRICAI